MKTPTVSMKPKLKITNEPIGQKRKREEPHPVSLKNFTSAVKRVLALPKK